MRVRVAWVFLRAYNHLTRGPGDIGHVHCPSLGTMLQRFVFACPKFMHVISAVVMAIVYETLHG